MAGNKALSAANKAKQDEFYTQLVDIENELKHYKEHFRGKVVLCNCDDPYESNFFKYFAMNFSHLGLKKLICTCYAGSPVIYTQLTFSGEEEVVGTETTGKKPYKIEITEVKDLNGDGAVDLADVELLLRTAEGKPELLKGDGDFRSAECIELIDFIERQQVIINQLRSLDDPEPAELTMLVGVCPACTKQTDQAESPYRCRYCGKALIWRNCKPQEKETSE